MNNQIVSVQEKAKSDFLQVCSIKRLASLVGQGNEGNFLSDFLILAGQINTENFKELAKCCIEIASMKLPILKQAGQAYVVPRSITVGKGTKNEKKIPILDVEIGYKGWLVLARRAGIAVKTYPIFDGDNFSFDAVGVNQSFRYSPSIENLSADKDSRFVENKLRFIAVCTKDLKSDVEDVSVLDINLLKRLRSKSPSSDSPAYRDWLLEMYNAKAIKYVLKKLPLDTLDTTIFKAFAVDDKNDVGYKEIEEDKPLKATSAFRKSEPQVQEVQETLFDQNTGEILEGQILESNTKNQ